MAIATAPNVQTSAVTPRLTRDSWLFSPKLDLLAFGGSTLLSLLLLAFGYYAGVLYSDSPEWIWICAVLLCDVAHVWATGYRVLLAEEWKRHRLRYIAVPLFGYGISVILYRLSPLSFWRTLAYVAVFHFVRQQVGWVALYRAKAGDIRKSSRVIDELVTYGVTLIPLVYWHLALPRQFQWFVQSDFVAFDISLSSARLLASLAILALLSLSALSAWRDFGTSYFSPGKHLVIVSTALCYWIGIVALNSDYAFTVTNVFIHGIPYLFLVYRFHEKRRSANSEEGRTQSTDPVTKVALWIAPLLLIAFTEELLWDRAVWHDREWLFGAGWNVDDLLAWIVPLLALPQLCHYVWDRWIWRRGSHPALSALFGGGTTR